MLNCMKSSTLGALLLRVWWQTREVGGLVRILDLECTLLNMP